MMRERYYRNCGILRQNIHQLNKALLCIYDDALRLMVKAEEEELKDTEVLLRITCNRVSQLYEETIIQVETLSRRLHSHPIPYSLESVSGIPASIVAIIPGAVPSDCNSEPSLQNSSVQSIEAIPPAVT